MADGNTSTVNGNQTTTSIHGSGNTNGVDNSTHVVHTSSTTTDNSVHDDSVHSTSLADSSVHDNSVHDNSSSCDNSVHANTSIHQTSHQNTGMETHLGF